MTRVLSGVYSGAIDIRPDRQAKVQVDGRVRSGRQNGRDTDTRLHVARSRDAGPVVGRMTIAPPRPVALPSASAGGALFVFNCGAGEPGINWRRTTAERLHASGFNMVPAALINRAATDVPPQHALGNDAGWCCGPNSALRAGIMMGRTAPAADHFINDCPRYNTAADFLGLATRLGRPLLKTLLPPLRWIPTASVGPIPEDLRDYLGHCGMFSGVNVRAARLDRWPDMVDHLRHVLSKGHPSIALLVWGQTRMHYVCVVGIHEGLGMAAILDTDGLLYEMPLEELHTEMLARGTMPQRLGYFKSYNAVDFP